MKPRTIRCPKYGTLLPRRNKKAEADSRSRRYNSVPAECRIGGEDNLLQRQFDVVIERDEEGNYVASVPQLPGCHTQGRSLDEVTERIREAVELSLEVAGVPEQVLEFVGIQRISVAA